MNLQQKQKSLPGYERLICKRYLTGMGLIKYLFLCRVRRLTEKSISKSCNTSTLPSFITRPIKVVPLRLIDKNIRDDLTNDPSGCLGLADPTQQNIIDNSHLNGLHRALDFNQPLRNSFINNGV